MNAGAAPAAPDGTARVEGPSFPLLIKAAATLVVAALLFLVIRAWEDFRGSDLGVGEVGFLSAAGLVVGLGYATILLSRTSIDGSTIRQTGPWTKQVHLADITQVKLIQVPGLAWLIVPRLVVRTRGPGFTTFQTGDAQVLAAFRRLAYG